MSSNPDRPCPHHARIQCAQCATCALTVGRGKLYIEHKHHGETHLTIVRIVDLVAMMQEELLAV